MDITIMNKSGFTAGTLVHTNRGLVPIKDIKVGDMVLSRDQHNAEGELVYKPVLRTIVTENAPVFFATFTPESVDDLPFEQQNNFDLYVDVLCTDIHPVWIQDKGWVKASDIEMNDIAILQSGEFAFCETVDTKSLQLVFYTDKYNVGYIPNLLEQRNQGRFVDLNTGRTLSFGGYNPVFRKLFVQDTDWKKRLLEQTPESEREHAEFFGFRQGEWRDPDTVEWGEGEGSLTMTVYNIEVEDTHTYFVGEAGIWVHDGISTVRLNQ